MQKYLRNALLFLIAVFALLALMARFTNATVVLETTNAIFLAFACSFFIVSIVIWLISWGYLIKTRSRVGFTGSLFVGFSAVYAALTPIQLGADMLRAISLKERFNVPYSESIAASMVVKGIKFLLIALFSSTAILLFIFSAKANLFVLTGMLSGFIVVLLATMLFLLPLKKSFGLKIAGFFGRFSSTKLQKFFLDYSNYLSMLGRKSFLLVALLSALSLSFEFLALLFSFHAISLAIPITSVAVLFVLISILERTPFLPRGIGLVEGIGFAFLSMPFVALHTISVGRIGALLIVFDFVRLVVPSLLSIAAYALFVSKR